MKSEFEAEQKRTSPGMWDQDSDAWCGTSYSGQETGLGCGMFTSTALMLWEDVGGAARWSRAFDVEELLQGGLPGTVSIRGGAPWGGASPGRSINRGYFKRAGPTTLT